MKQFKSCRFLAVLFLLLAGQSSNTRGHDITGYQPLGVTGFLAPFGLSSQHTYTEVWGEGDFAFLGSMSDGVAIIDVSDGTSPSLASSYHSPDLVDVSDVKSKNGIGFFASANGGGIHIVDITDPIQPTRIAQLNSLAVQGFDNVSELAVEDHYLFAVSATSPSVKVFDISDAANPSFFREFTTPETVGLNDIQVTDNRVYVAGLAGKDGAGAVFVYERSEVVDQSVSPTEIGRISSGSNTASLFVNENTNHLLATQQELGGKISVWNIEDITNPNQLVAADISEFALNSFSTGEVVVDGQIAYVAWYEAGFQILDLDNLATDGTLQLLGGYDTSPFSNPLDGLVGNRSVFPFLGPDKVLLSDTEWGFFIVDATPALPLIGDIDGNGQLDANDIDQLTIAIQNGNTSASLDLDGDGSVSLEDRTFLISEIMGSSFGDTNLDGSFDSTDLVRVFISGTYEDDIDFNSSWAEGDWNGDRDFSSGDLIAAFSAGNYEDTSGSQTVPEPAGILIGGIFGLALHVYTYRRKRNDRD